MPQYEAPPRARDFEGIIDEDSGELTIVPKQPKPEEICTAWITTDKTITLEDAR